LLYFFEKYVIDTERRELRHGADAVSLQPQVFDLLEHLIRNRERVVSKDELIASIWGGRIVSESALITRINAARTAIGDSGAEQRSIKTLPRKGVRFIANVREQQALEPDAAAAVQPGLRLPDKPSIAVLPFQNMSGDPGQDYFADGVVEEIITALSRFRQLFVIARNSSFTYKGQSVDVKQVGRELGVRYVLEGSVRRSADRVRITAQLVDAASRVHLWANRYDRSIDDLFKVQDDITAAISATVEPEIGAAERDRSRRRPPESLGAWELFQRGMWHLLRQNFQDSTEAQSFFQRSIELDANFAAPHAALAVLLFFRIARSWDASHDEVLVEMRRQASAAIEIDSKDFLGHTALGLCHMERAEFGQSIGEHKTALSLNANSPLAHWAYGYALQRADQFSEALEEFEVALRLNPTDPSNWSHLTLKAATLYLLGRYEEAATCARDATRNPTVDLLWPYIHLAAALGQLGHGGEARAAVAELERRRPELTISEFAKWPHNKNRSAIALARITQGLRKAGLPE
jgi:TolB-like protein/Tfp pilus assembly protein PilF